MKITFKLLLDKILFKFLLLFIYVFIIVVYQVYSSQGIPLAVMIGNSPPEVEHQTGLISADIIYEIDVEYPFTRLMAIYLQDKSVLVGPIRSSRYYFSRLAREWSPVFVHCGGQSFRDEKIIDLDEMHYPSPYWRDKNIGGWINLFTNTKNIREKIKKMGFPEKIEVENFFSGQRVMEVSGGNISRVSLKYNQKYLVSYQYNKDGNYYLRLVNSNPHQDSRSFETITVSNIIVQYVKEEKIVQDEEGRINVEVIGEGVAKIFYGGHYYLAKWIKESKDHATKYYDNQGNLLPLNQGKVWIHLVSDRTELWFK